MREVRWSKRATEQLHHAIEYISIELSPIRAKIVLTKILRTTSLLSNNPRMGAKEPLLDFRNKEYRFLIAWSYKIIYKVTANDDILIMRVFHSSQNPKKITK